MVCGPTSTGTRKTSNSESRMAFRTQMIQLPLEESRQQWPSTVKSRTTCPRLTFRELQGLWRSSSGIYCSRLGSRCTSTKVSCALWRNSPPSAVRETSMIVTTKMTLAQESSRHSSHISTKRPVCTMKIMSGKSHKELKSGDKLFTGSLKLGAQKNLMEKMQAQSDVITNKLEIGLVHHTHLKMVCNTMAEDHSSFLGIITMEHSRKPSLKPLTMVTCTF